MLIGTNLNETTSLNGDFDPSSFSLDDAALRNRLKSSLHLNDESSLDALIATYQTTRPRSTPSDIYFAVTTDVDFRIDAIAQAERKVSQRSAPVYMYRFDWPLPIEGGRFKAAHGAEIPFVFDNLDKAPNWVNQKRDPPTVSRQSERSMGCFRAHGQSQSCQPASLACLRPGCPRHYASQRRVPCGERSGESRARGPH